MADQGQDFAGQSIIPAAMSMMVLTTVAVILRFVSRRITRVHLWWDDWLILAALPFCWFECVVDIAGVGTAGFGTHIYTFSSWDEVKLFLGFTYGYQIAYCIALTLPKFSMIAMYWRVFGAASFKWPLIITAVMTGMYLIAVVLVAVLSCIPIVGFWDRTIPAQCLSLLNFYIGQAVATIILDIILLAIPIIPIRRLNITTSQKVAVVGIFGLGIFVTISSAVRLNALVMTQTNPTAAMDPSYYFVAASVWSFVETCLSVVCACLPSMRPLLRYVLHGKFRSSGGASSGAMRPGYGSAVESANRGSTFGISNLATRAGVRTKLPSQSALERSNRWERVNSKRDSKRPSLPPKLASFPLAKLGGSVSVAAAGSATTSPADDRPRAAPFGWRDNWRELPDPADAGHRRHSSLIAPWDDTAPPRSRVRTMYEAEDRVRRVLSPTGEREDNEKDLEAGDREREGSGASGPLRLDEVEVSSEHMSQAHHAPETFGYRYEISAGAEGEERHSSSEDSTDKAWEVWRRGS